MLKYGVKSNMPRISINRVALMMSVRIRVCNYPQSWTLQTYQSATQLHGQRLVTEVIEMDNLPTSPKWDPLCGFKADSGLELAAEVAALKVIKWMNSSTCKQSRTRHIMDVRHVNKALWVRRRCLLP